MKRLVAILSLCVLLAALLPSCSWQVGYLYENADQYTAGGAELAEPVKNLNIDWFDGEVRILTDTADTVRVTETADGEISDRMRLRYWLDGDTLRVRYAAPVAVLKSFATGGKVLTVTLPAGTELDQLTVSAASATVTTDQLTAEKVKITSSSGDVDVNASGDLKALEISTSSGNFHVTLEHAETVDWDSASGDLTVNARGIGQLTADSASGKIIVDLSETLGGAEIDTASGDVALALPEGAAFTAIVDTASGDFDCDFPTTSPSGKKNVYEVNGGGAELQFDTASGDIRIKMK